MGKWRSRLASGGRRAFFYPSYELAVPMVRTGAVSRGTRSRTTLCRLSDERETHI